jgi:hypothetical protein
LQAAKQGLLEAIQLFKSHFNAQAERTQLHNIFGELKYQEWLWFHYKHFTHHFSQFGIIPTVDRIN